MKEAVEAEAEAVVEELDHLLASLHLQGRAKLLYQLQQTLKQWDSSHTNSPEIELKQTNSSKKSRHTSTSMKMLLFILYYFIVLRHRLSSNLCGSTTRDLASFPI